MKFLLSILLPLIPSVILTVGAGAIMPIGTGIIGVPEKDKTLLSICPVEIIDKYKWTDCWYDLQTSGHKIFSVLITSHSLSIQTHSEHTKKT